MTILRQNVIILLILIILLKPTEEDGYIASQEYDDPNVPVVKNYDRLDLTDQPRSSEVQRRVRQIMFEDKISEQELMAYYQAHPDQFGGPFQEVIPSIEALVRIERARALLASEPSR